jgi:hypothetical protein
LALATSGVSAILRGVTHLRDALNHKQLTNGFLRVLGIIIVSRSVLKRVVTRALTVAYLSLSDEFPAMHRGPTAYRVDNMTHMHTKYDVKVGVK